MTRRTLCTYHTGVSCFRGEGAWGGITMFGQILGSFCRLVWDLGYLHEKLMHLSSCSSLAFIFRHEHDCCSTTQSSSRGRACNRVQYRVSCILHGPSRIALKTKNSYSCSWFHPTFVVDLKAQDDDNARVSIEVCPNNSIKSCQKGRSARTRVSTYHIRRGTVTSSVQNSKT